MIHINYIFTYLSPGDGDEIILGNVKYDVLEPLSVCISMASSYLTWYPVKGSITMAYSGEIPASVVVVPADTVGDLSARRALVLVFHGCKPVMMTVNMYAMSAVNSAMVRTSNCDERTSVAFAVVSLGIYIQ